MRIKHWQTLHYLQPRGVLVALRAFALANPLHELPYAIGALRTNELRPIREGRQCALFCYGMSQFLGVDVRYAHDEQSDTDFVGRYERFDEVHFVPIQLKELVPSRVRTEVDLQHEIDKLSKYADSPDLVVAFHLNRDIQVELSALDFSKVPVKELWFFGALSRDQLQWRLIGNLLSVDARYFEFRYPEA
jgi:hypothetical protein